MSGLSIVWPPSKPWSAIQTLPSTSLTGSDLPALIRIVFAAGTLLSAALKSDVRLADAGRGL